MSDHGRPSSSDVSSTNMDKQSQTGTGSRRRHAVITKPAWAKDLPADDDLHNKSTERLPTERTLNGRPTLPVPFIQSSSTIPPREGNAKDTNETRDIEANRRSGEIQRPQEAHAHGWGPDASRWWTFTLPQKYIDRVTEYMSGHDDHDHSDDDEQDEKARLRHGRQSMERAMTGEKDGEARTARRRHSFSRMMTAQLHPHDFSVHQAWTPGWESPWRPFERSESLFGGVADPFSNNAGTSEVKMNAVQGFFLRSAFAPLTMRAINLSAQIVTLGLASHIRIQESNAGVKGIVGSSTIFCIVISPLAIVHIFVNLYIEYFGSPIGIWHVRTKMSHTLLEVLFIILFSANMSLAFDDLITSSLECTPWKPYARYNEPVDVVGTGAIEGTVADSLCGQQIGLCVTITLSVLFYVAVLVVSLFRIFYKVEGRR